MELAVNCSAKYVGQTHQPIITRLNEHFAYLFDDGAEKLSAIDN